MDYGKVLHNQKIEKFLPLILWCVLIFIGSSLPSASASKNPLIDFIVHKSVHIVEYFVLFIFAYKAFNKKFLAGFIFVIIYSLSDEFHQRFVPGRNGRIKDSFVDLTGALLGALVIWRFLQILPRKLRNWLLK